MDANKILSSSLLDLVFDARNKEYGAYDLRKSYQRRINKSLLITAALLLMVFAGSLLAKSMSSKDADRWTAKQVTLIELPPEDVVIPKPIELPRPEKIDIRTEKLTNPVIVDDKDVKEPPPTQDDLKDARIDVVQHDGIDDQNIATPEQIDDGKKLVEASTTPSNEPFTKVEIDAEFPGDAKKWLQFLERNCNGEVATEHGASLGEYRVVIRFVVDEDGTVSDIQPMTNLGHGMEEEAMRVVKKAASMKWTPAFQNGKKVKAYRSQPFTFQVLE